MKRSADEPLRGKLCRLPPLKDRLGYFGREKSQTEHAGNICPAKSLGACNLARPIHLATGNSAEPFIGADESLDEIGVRLGGSLLRIDNDQLGFNAPPMRTVGR